MADRALAFERRLRAVTTARPAIDGLAAEGLLNDLLDAFGAVEGIDRVRLAKRRTARLRYDGTARLLDDASRVARRLTRAWRSSLDGVNGDGVDGEAHHAAVTPDEVVFRFVAWGERIGCAAGRLTVGR